MTIVVVDSLWGWLEGARQAHQFINFTLTSMSLRAYWGCRQEQH